MDQSRRRCNTSGIAAGIALPLGLNQVSDSEPSVLTEYTCIFYYFLELFWIIRFWNDGNCFGDPKRFVSSRFYWSMVVSAGWLPVLLASLLEDLCVFSCRQFELQYTFCPFFFCFRNFFISHYFSICRAVHKMARKLSVSSNSLNQSFFRNWQVWQNWWGTVAACIVHYSTCMDMSISVYVCKQAAAFGKHEQCRLSLELLNVAKLSHFIELFYLICHWGPLMHVPSMCHIWAVKW